jgi:hypothetical protein
MRKRKEISEPERCQSLPYKNTSSFEEQHHSLPCTKYYSTWLCTSYFEEEMNLWSASDQRIPEDEEC